MRKWLKVSPQSGSGNAEISNSSTHYKGRKKRVSSVVSYVKEIDSAKAYTVYQEPSEEYLIVDKNEFSVSQENNEIEITGKSNSLKLLFSRSLDSDISFIISENYVVNGYINAKNGEDVPNDIGSSGEFIFSMKIIIPKNNSNLRTGELIITGSEESIIQRVTITQDISTYRISYSKNEFIQSIQKDSEEIEFGGTATNVATLPPNTQQYSYEFDGWYDNDEGVKVSSSLNLSIIGINKVKNIIAKGVRKVNNYDLNFSITPVGRGTVSGGGTYPYNSRVRCFSTPKDGYNFIKFIDEEGSEFFDNPSFFDVLKDRNIQAVFQIKTYSVILKSEYRIKESGSFILGEVGGTVSGGETSVNHGDFVTLVASPKEGYDFVGWYGGSNLLSDRLSYSIQVVSNKNILARFQRKWFTIKFVAGSGGRVEPTEDRVEYGGSTSSLAIPLQGSNFQSWSNGSLSERINIVNVKSDAIYSASFGENLYSINYILGEGILELSSTGETVSNGNSAIGSTATVEEGYEFDGWYINGVKVSSSLTYIPQNVTSSFEVIAKAKIKKFNISAILNYRDGDNFGDYIRGENGGTVSGSGEYDYGSIATLVASPKEGYDFVGWYDSEGGELSTELEYSIYNISQEEIIYSRFQKKWFTVNYISGIGVEEFSKKSDRVAYGGSVTSERIVLSENYNSASWYLTSGNAVLNVSNFVATLLNVRSDCQLTASAVLNKYRISYSKNEFIQSIQKDSEEVEFGGTATNVATLPPNTQQYSYEFDGWYDGDVMVSEELSLEVMNISSNRLFSAKGIRNLNRYNITVTNGSGSGNYGYGERVIITADNIPGKTFLQWSDGVKTSSRTITVTEDKTYTAQYSTNVYTVSYIAGEGIFKLSIVSESVEYGGNAIGSTATVEEGYEFDGWYIGTEKVSSSLTYSMKNITSNVTLNAKAVLKKYNVEAEEYYKELDGTGEFILGEVGGTVSGGGIVSHGGSSSFVASPKEGYDFVGWFTLPNGGDLLSISTTYIINNIISNIKIYARFSKIYYTVIYNIGDENILNLSRYSERVVYGENGIGCVMTLKSDTDEYLYSVDGWYNFGGTKVSSEAEYIPMNVKSNLGFTARGKYVYNAFRITYTKGEHILSINRTSEVVVYGNNALGCQATLPPNTQQYSYEFDGWYDGGGEKVSSSILISPKNVINNAEYECRGIRTLNRYSVGVSLESYSTGRGFVSGGGTYEYGKEITVSCTKNNAEDIFDGWYKNGVKVSSEMDYSFTVFENVNLEARIIFLEINSSELQFESSGGTKTLRVNSSVGFTIE